MIKKVVVFLTCCCLFGLLSWPVQHIGLAQTQSDMAIPLQHQVVVAGTAVNPSGQRTRFDLYDMSQLAAMHHQEPHYFQTLKTQAQTIQTIIKAEHLALIDSQTTNDVGQLVFHVPQVLDKTYLIVQRQPEFISQNGQTDQVIADPIVLTMSADIGTAPQAMLQTKTTLLKQQPYFFKYGRTRNQGEKPLSGVSFVLYQLWQQQKYYLTPDGGWCPSHQPKHDPQVKKIQSDSQGLVMLREFQLPAGQYFFEEIQTQPGFLISQAARAIRLEVPAMAAGHERPPMRLNGEPIWQTAADQLPNSVMATAQPRIINEHQPPATGTARLPDTGQAKTMMSLMGLSIVSISTILFAGWYKKRG